MSQLGPAPAEPLNETQAKAKAIADASAAEAEAKNAAHAAHDANQAANTSGLYWDRAEKERAIQDAAMAERYAPDNVASDENADKAEAAAKDARANAVKVLGKEEAATKLPPEPEFDPKVAGRGKR
jgi:hypothetical protein